ncbi:peptidoglycan editing factor PgeF [Priestia megaterium]|nr:peptidoglycan editing factor PgeF [Priestia megaterium]
MNSEPFKKSHHESFMWLSSWMDDSEKLVAGFTTKNGGVSTSPFSSFNLGLHVNDDAKTVITNREHLAEKLNMPLSNWVCAEQVHGNTIQKVTKTERGKGIYEYADGISGTDGLYTNESDVLLALCYADCVPLYFYAPSHNMIGLAHAGWKGTVKNIGGRMIDCWVNQEQIPVEDIYVTIGPSIEACCYTVDKRVISFVDAIAKDANVYTEVSTGQYALDLKQLNAYLLKNAGVLDKQIIVSSYCTSCQDELFFSHRRDQGKTGRMFSFIGFKED